MVLDIYHGDEVEGQRDGSYSGFAKLKAAGFEAVIHKATEGVRSHDPELPKRRQKILDAGLMLGMYDFNTSDPPKQQVDYFFSTAQPDKNTMCFLDWEDNTHGQMTLAQCVEYLQYADAKLSALCGVPKFFGLYSGNRAKEQLIRADAATRAFLAQHRLWLCEYGPVARMNDANGKPLPWPAWWLWQRDADGSGPDFHNAPGIVTRNVDLNVYAGTADQLRMDWIS